ncbi:unnamed protein product [Aphis gossypii]|uniref:Uncharacterized protein n=1 Tax=Aphis gossypii TaxID=80765 RepID=A0A9P0NBA0_APHGO|nr:unnamed protein product [Aphis gossypii]
MLHTKYISCYAWERVTMELNSLIKIKKMYLFMYVYYTLIYTSYTLGPRSILYEDDVNLSPEFEGNIVKYHANTFLCRDCSVHDAAATLRWQQSADTKGPRTLQQLSVYE